MRNPHASNTTRRSFCSKGLRYLLSVASADVQNGRSFAFFLERGDSVLELALRYGAVVNGFHDALGVQEHAFGNLAEVKVSVRHASRWGQRRLESRRDLS